VRVLQAVMVYVCSYVRLSQVEVLPRRLVDIMDHWSEARHFKFVMQVHTDQYSVTHSARMIYYPEGMCLVSDLCKFGEIVIFRKRCKIET